MRNVAQLLAWVRTKFCDPSLAETIRANQIAHDQLARLVLDLRVQATQDARRHLRPQEEDLRSE